MTFKSFAVCVPLRNFLLFLRTIKGATKREGAEVIPQFSHILAVICRATQLENRANI